MDSNVWIAMCTLEASIHQNSIGCFQMLIVILVMEPQEESMEGISVEQVSFLYGDDVSKGRVVYNSSLQTQKYAHFHKQPLVFSFVLLFL